MLLLPLHPQTQKILKMEHRSSYGLQSLMFLLIDQGAVCFLCQLWLLKQTGSWSGELIHSTKDDRQVIVSSRWLAMFDDNGHVKDMLESNVDITERKKGEEALRLSYVYNRSLIEASLDPLVTIGYDGKITDVNEAAERVTGYSRGELIGTDFTNYFTDPEKAKKGYQEVFKEGFMSDYSLEIRHKSGKTIPVLYNASVYQDESGDVIGIFAAARDITERKEAEKILKLKLEELARSNEELEQFAYVSSHDLQEPLRMITIYLQLLQRKYQGKLDDKADMYIHFAVDGASRMQNLIQDLLEYSRVTRTSREPESTNCKVILNQALSNLKVVILEFLFLPSFPLNFYSSMDILSTILHSIG
jgi:PAS domain S-box-containing protein